MAGTLMAVLLAGEADATDPPGLWPFAGRTVLEWQASAAFHAGATRILVLAERLPEPMASRLLAMPGVERARSHADLAVRLTDPAADMLFLVPGQIIDPRFLQALADAASGPALATLAADMAPPSAERIDRETLWAGALRVPQPLMADVLAQLGDWDMGSTLLRATEAAGAHRIAADSIPCADPDARSDRPLLWVQPDTAGTADRVMEPLIASAEAHAPDWADRLLHLPLARRLTALLLPTSATPAILEGVALLMALGAWVALCALPLAYGLILLALLPVPLAAARLLGALAMEPVRVRCHAAAMAVGAAGAALLIGWRLWAMGAGGWILAVAAVQAGITLMAWAKLGWYRRHAGRHLDSRGRADRLAGGWRHPVAMLVWPLLPLGLAGLWPEGLALALGLSLASWAVLEWRLLLAVEPKG